MQALRQWQHYRKSPHWPHSCDEIDARHSGLIQCGNRLLFVDLIYPHGDPKWSFREVYLSVGAGLYGDDKRRASNSFEKECKQSGIDGRCIASLVQNSADEADAERRLKQMREEKDSELQRMGSSAGADRFYSEEVPAIARFALQLRAACDQQLSEALFMPCKLRLTVLACGQNGGKNAYQVLFCTDNCRPEHPRAGPQNLRSWSKFTAFHTVCKTAAEQSKLPTEPMPQFPSPKKGVWDTTPEQRLADLQTYAEHWNRWDDDLRSHGFALCAFGKVRMFTEIWHD